VGVTIDVGVASAYNFRGLNVFGIDQFDQHVVFSPSLSYAILDTGLTIGYWGAYQVNGKNLSANVANGVGHEQDIYLSYDIAWLEDTLALNATLTAFLYPFATKAGAGVRCPAYIEPSVKLSYATVLDLSLQVAYFAGLQDAVKDYRYLYIRPYISKSFAIGTRLTQTLGVGYGFKLYNDRDVMTDNVHDIAFDIALAITAAEGFTVTPAIRGGWTDKDGIPIGSEYFFLGSLNLNYAF